MSIVATRTTRLRFCRFGYLMGMYSENYVRLSRTFDPMRLERGSYLSSIDDGLDVRLDVLECHRYTLELRLTYGLLDPVTGEADPSAYIRLYTDARQAEATHCYAGKCWQDVLGLRPALPVLVGYRLRMNAFLGKWLEYLGEQGHSRFTLSRVPSESQPREESDPGPFALTPAQAAP